ncbi:MAG TPA: glycosyltransferase family 2 protein [Anaerolineae bacterium]|nr:glycosyltransferase family 2 protein [Anaerolineae bacterium]
MLDVAVVIVTWNVAHLIEACLRSLYTELVNIGGQGKVWVVDNGSTDGTIAVVREKFPQAVLMVNEENVGFGRANNQGMWAANDEVPTYYFLLNPDTVVKSGALASLIGCLETRPKVGMVGPRLVYGDGRLQHSGFRFPGVVQLAYDLFDGPARWYETGVNGRYPRQQYESHRSPFMVETILGAAMLLRREVFEVTQGFDPLFHMYCEELDWCRRIAAAGWSIYVVPAAEIVHYAGESTGQVKAQSVLNLWQSRARLYERHYDGWRWWLARWLAERGLRRRAAAAEGEMRQAYEIAGEAWR